MPACKRPIQYLELERRQTAWHYSSHLSDMYMRVHVEICPPLAGLVESAKLDLRKARRDGTSSPPPRFTVHVCRILVLWPQFSPSKLPITSSTKYTKIKALRQGTDLVEMLLSLVLLVAVNARDYQIFSIRRHSVQAAKRSSIPPSQGRVPTRVPSLRVLQPCQFQTILYQYDSCPAFLYPHQRQIQ